MKQNFLLLMLLSGFASQGQNVIPEMDKSKCTGIVQSSKQMKPESTVFINPPSADLKWKPNLSYIDHSIEHEGPNEEYIDSMNKVNFNFKRQYTRTKSAEKTSAVSPAIGSNFIGNPSDGVTPLDNSVAISDAGRIVSVSNREIYYYNTSGVATYWSPLSTFLPSTFGISDICDPVVIYDSRHDRFVMFCQQSPIVSGGQIYVCFSMTNDPSAGWWCSKLNGDASGGTDGFDYPKLAVNDSELFITGNMYYEPSGVFHQATIFQMNLLQGYAGISPTYVYYNNLPANPSTLLPVSYGHTGAITTGMFLVSTYNSGGDSIFLYQVIGNNCCSPNIYKYATHTSRYYTPSDGQQAGTSLPLKIRDCRMLSGFYLNGIIHFVFSSGNPTLHWDEINYNRLDLTTLTNISSTFGLSGSDYAYPSVASFATSPTDNSVMIGFEKSNASIYPEIRVVNCDNTMNWSGSTLVRAGDSYVDYTFGSPERWGDYTGMSRRHNSTTPSVWMSASYGNSLNRWSTWIAEVHTGSPVTETHDISEATSKTKIFPNPITDNFTIQFSLKEFTTLNISILDMAGRLVKELYTGSARGGDNSFSFDKSNLTTGTYFVTIKSQSDIIKNEKIIIN